jgi:E3 ubiquitin-protein ligase listerin
MLHIPDVREQIFFFLCNTASTYQCESTFGTWCMATQDVDRLVASYASKSWNDAISLSDSRHSGKLVLDEVLTPCLISFLQKACLDPGLTYSHLNPVQPTVVSIPSKKVSGRGTPLPSRIETPDSPRSKAEEDEENEQDRKARLRVGAFGAIGWILGNSNYLENIFHFFKISLFKIHARKTHHLPRLKI